MWRKKKGREVTLTQRNIELPMGGKKRWGSQTGRRYIQSHIFAKFVERVERVKTIVELL